MDERSARELTKGLPPAPKKGDLVDVDAAIRRMTADGAQGAPEAPESSDIEAGAVVPLRPPERVSKRSWAPYPWIFIGGAMAGYALAAWQATQRWDYAAGGVALITLWLISSES